MCTPTLCPSDEAASVGAESVLREWLAAVRGVPLGTAAALRAWARHDPAAFRTEFAAFARIDPALAEAASGWLLGAGVRLDDRVMWTGDPADPCLAGLAAIGGRLAEDHGRVTIVRDRPPIWPPPLRPRVADPDGP